MRGLGGDDLICGDECHDQIFGLDGPDTLFGDNGNDVVNGGDGSDFEVVGDNGNDTLIGEAGDDKVNSFDFVVGNDNLDGGPDTDICTSDPDPQINCEI